MKIVTLVLLIGCFLSVQAQNLRLERVIPKPNVNGDWGNDISVYPFQPLGKMSSVQASDGTIYTVVNDTSATSNVGIIVYYSTNSGTTWTMHPIGIAYRGQLANLKIIRGPQDSIYAFGSTGSQIYCWNVKSNSFNPFPFTGYRDFDVVCSSSGSLYMFLDSLPNQSLVRYGSINGGFNWYNRGNVTSTAAGVKLTMSATGDTLILNYQGPVLADTSTSIIRQARYRETAPGTIASVAFIDVVTDAVPKKEYASAFGNGESWVIYTSGNDGARMIYGKKSVNNGLSYGAAELISPNLNTDQYWFDVKYVPNIGNGNSGFALVYYSDSLQTGIGTNSTDKIMYCTAPYGGSFGAPIQISNVPPVFSDRNYSPQVVPMPYTNNDVGALWVGENIIGRKLWWDRLNAIVPVELTSFTAVYNKNNVELAWSTSTETNNKGFAVERNVSGKWQQLSFITGKGNSSVLTNYSFSDNVYGLNADKIIYRLKQIDFDGTFKYSDEVQVNLLVPDAYSLEQNYPNPFNPSTIIRYSLPFESNVKITLFNSIGEKVRDIVNSVKEAGNFEINFNAAGLTSGIYFYSIEASAVNGNDNFRSTRKMTLIR